MLSVTAERQAIRSEETSVNNALDLERELHSQSNDCTDLELFPDHQRRACFVCKNGSIYVEARSPMFRMATDFLIAIAEPQSRPEFVHHYRLTAYSLYAGASVNLDTETILRTLNKISKNKLPATVTDFIKYFTQSYGKAKLVLKRNRVFVESKEEEVLMQLLNNQVIRAARKMDTLHRTKEKKESKASRRVHLGDDDETLSAARKKKRAENDGNDDNEEEEERDTGATRYEEGEDDERQSYVSFEIDPKRVGDVKREASRMNFPLLEEYDYLKDDINPDLEIHLKGNVRTREYQDKALSKMFGNSRARSGVIVLPCGAGKTLTGISAACTIHKSTLVLCSNTVACTQWIQQFQYFTNIAPDKILKFIAGKEPAFPTDGSAVLLATTYSMMGMSDDSRGAESRRTMEKLRSREWGLLILDEVHIAPAEGFRKALFEVKTHCKLGLTATLVREDGQIGDLNFLIGPKLYEADWMQLTDAGYLARVQCAEVWCPMSSLFMREYLKEEHDKRRQFLYVMNPNKYAACEFLMKEHERMGDKILIFSDTVASVEEYGKELHRHYMYGNTPEFEREDLLDRFRMKNGTRRADGEEAIQTLIISKIGDVAIDLPNASVIIQVSSHFASRRQEAQRLGRILRPKQTAAPGRFNATFYTLISMDTKEMLYSGKRRQYLIDQGYAYKVVLWNALFPTSTGDFHDLEVQEQFLKEVSLQKANMKEKNIPDDVIW